MAETGANPNGPVDVLTIVGAMAAVPYAIAVLGGGLRGLAAESYPRALGERWYGERDPQFPHGGAPLVIAAIVLLIGAMMLAGLVATVRQHKRGRWVSVAWLLLAIPAVYGFASNPDRSRRCFVDGYSDRLVCASGATVAIRDFVLLSLPAVVAIVCLLWAGWAHRDRAGTAGPAPTPGR